MIGVSQTSRGYVFSGDYAPGWTAFLDADWVVEGAPAEIPALVADQAQSIRWCDSPLVPVPGLEAETAAGTALVDVARAAAAATHTNRSGPVEISGEGIVAKLTGTLLRSRIARGGTNASSPSVVVDCTGDPHRIDAATRSLADLGTLVLAGAALGRPINLQLYPDVHVRGLRLVGVELPLQRGVVGPAADVDDQLWAVLRSTLCTVRPGAEVAPGAAWYRVLF